MQSQWTIARDGLLADKVVATPTDTVYGLLGLTGDPAVLTHYQHLKKDRDKPYIILISKLVDLKLFGVELDQTITDILHQLWPGPTSVILPCLLPPSLSHIPTMDSSGQATLAFRLPDFSPLIELIDATGPVFAPSCNPSGLPPATTPEEVLRYFSPGDDLVIPAFTDILTGSPSTIIDLSVTPYKIIRAGANLPHITNILHLD